MQLEIPVVEWTEAFGYPKQDGGQNKVVVRKLNALCCEIEHARDSDHIIPSSHLILISSIMDWTLGHPEKHTIVTHLLTFRIASNVIVPIDSMVIDSIYGQHTRKSARHRHFVQQFSFDTAIDPVARVQIYTAFETHKALLDINNAVSYLETSSNIAKLIYDGVETIKSIGDDSYDTLLWYVIILITWTSSINFKKVHFSICPCYPAYIGCPVV